jgi:hypothetical protein
MHGSVKLIGRSRPQALLLVMLALACVGVLAGSQKAAADPLGGPVIIGGDDLTDHGSLEGGKPDDGWLYIQRALENISPKVSRTNDGSVAALGSSLSESDCCDAGAAIGYAAAEAGLTVNYYDGADEVRRFFAELDAGTAKPRIIWISGNGAGNDLDGDEPQALIDNATKIADFVNAGGGLMSHGSEFGWLSALLPGLNAVGGGSSGDLELTPEGTAAFPGVTNDDVNAGPWHNHFEGNFGGLQVLVKSNSVDDSNGNDAAVVLGGAAVQLPGAITLEPGTATNPVGGSHTVTATVRETDGDPLAGAEVTFSVTAGPNAGKSDKSTTGENGQTSFTYTDDGGAGTDTIEASFVDSTGATRTATATKTWEAAASPPPPPPPTEEAPPPPPPSPAASTPDPPPPPVPADLTISMTQEELGPAPTSSSSFAVTAGTRMRYLVTVTNNGPGVARDVTLDLGAPGGSSFDSVSTDTGSCSGTSTVSCSYGNLSVGQQAHTTATATIVQTGPATATATVGASGPDPSSANNTVSATVDVTAAAAGVAGQPTPIFGESAGGEVVSGFVCVQLPNTTECVDLATLETIPVGATIDATNGRARIQVATADGTIQTVDVYEGKAVLLQTTSSARSAASLGGSASVTEFRLTGGDFSTCAAKPAAVKTKKSKSKAKKTKKRKPAGVEQEQAKPRKPIRRLWGNGAGDFRTRGRYSSATVRGTVWLTEDYCNGTLIKVQQGTVTVRDLVKNRTVTVTAGKSYFAEPAAPKAAKAKAKPKKKATKKRKPAGGR